MAETKTSALIAARRDHIRFVICALGASLPGIMSSGACAQSLSTLVGPVVVLNTLWEYQSGTDWTTTSTESTAVANSPFYGLFYIPASTSGLTSQSIGGVQPYYLLLSPSGSDHMDSLTAGEGGYTTVGILGYAWTSPNAQPGLSSIIRMYDNVNGTANFGDHAAAVEVAPLPHAQTFPSYMPEGAIGNGYARFPGTDSVLAWMTGGGVTAKTNLAVGCALWEWWWGGTEFINDYDYGRQIQVSMYPESSTPPYAPVGSALGEAGDKYGYLDANGNVIPVDARHPSPCVSFSTNVSSPSPTQTTSAVPLEFLPDNHGGGLNNPIIYPAVQIGKTLTLNWAPSGAASQNWPVALFQTMITLPTTINATVEAPTGYLTSEFNTYYFYDPVHRVLTNVLQTTVNCDTFPANCSAGTTGNNGGGFPVPLTLNAPQAVILASGPGLTAIAMGVYINDPNGNSQFLLYDNSPGTASQTSSNFAKWEVHFDGGVTAPSWTYNTWIMTDTVQNVMNDMNQLQAWDVTSR